MMMQITLITLSFAAVIVFVCCLSIKFTQIVCTCLNPNMRYLIGLIFLDFLIYSAPQATEEELAFDGQVLEQLRFMFRFVDLTRTPLATELYLNDVDVNLWANDFETPILYSQLEQLFEDYLHMKADTRIDLMKHECRGSDRACRDNSDAESQVDDVIFDDSFSQSESIRQTMDEGCRRDYSALAEPVTSGIIRRVGRRVMKRVYADVTNQEEFCQISCDLLCKYLRPAACSPPLCYVPCTLLQVSENVTVDDIIEQLLDTFIPQIEAQPWGRKSKFVTLRTYGYVS